MLPLRELLVAVTSDRPSEGAVDEFVTFCRKTAVVLLRKKVAGGRLSLGHLSLSVDDLALDVIADLFSRNQDGRFVQLDAYLRGIDLAGLPEAELMSHLRRLIFAKVNQGIYRIYHDIDPSLSKVLRNIKVSINTLRNYDVVERFGEPYIRPAACDPLEHLPVIDPAALKREIARTCGKSETIPGLLAHLARFLREQHDHCRLVPLVQVAIVFRSLYAGVPPDDSAPSEAEAAVSVSDATEVIAAACAWVKERARKKYVESGKVASETFDHYFQVVEAALVSAIVDRDGEDVHYFEELSKRLPGLTRDEYLSRHRSKIEYLGRIAHRRAIKELKKMF